MVLRLSSKELLSPFFLILFCVWLIASCLFLWNSYESRPVSVDTVYKLTHTDEGYTLIDLEWVNQRNCRFKEVQALQGSVESEEQLRSPVEMDKNKPRGSKTMRILPNAPKKKKKILKGT